MAMDETVEYEITFVHPERPPVETIVDVDTSLFDAAIRASIDLGYGCYDGTCLNCLGRMLDGDIEHVQEPVALSGDLRQDDYVLLCVARARSPCTIEIGSHLRAEAYPSLWDE